MLLPLLLRNCRGRFGKQRKKPPLPPSPQNAAARAIHSLAKGKRKKRAETVKKKTDRYYGRKKRTLVDLLLSVLLDST